MRIEGFRHSLPARLSALVLLVLVFTSGAEAASREIRISRGSGSFLFVDEKGDPKTEMTVYTYLPRHVKAGKAAIVFVMHGHHRNAESNGDDWAQFCFI
jgi:hypothetical protein